MSRARGLALVHATAVLSGCSVAMALHGHPEPNFQAFAPGSTRQQVEIQLGRPVASAPAASAPDAALKQNTYRFEMGNSPNGHRALMNLYIDLATIGIWEIFGTIIEARMGHEEETRVTYDRENRVVAIDGYQPPPPSDSMKAAIEAQKQWDGKPPPATDPPSLRPDQK